MNENKNEKEFHYALGVAIVASLVSLIFFGLLLFGTLVVSITTGSSPALFFGTLTLIAVAVLVSRPYTRK